MNATLEKIVLVSTGFVAGAVVGAGLTFSSVYCLNKSPSYAIQPQQKETSSVKISNQPVIQFQKEKYQNKQQTESPLVNVPQSPQKQIQGVYFSKQDDCSSHIISLINSAQSNIYMEIYTFTDKDIANALVNARKRGVEVQAVFDKKQASIPSSLDEYVENAGIAIRYEGGSGIMHDKVLIIDRQLVSTGSFNFTKSADSVNNENVVVIQDKEIAEKYFQEFRKIWNISKR